MLMLVAVPSDLPKTPPARLKNSSQRSTKGKSSALNDMGVKRQDRDEKLENRCNENHHGKSLESAENS